MMMTSKKICIKRIFALITLIFSLSPLFSETANEKWTIAAQKFEYSKGQTTNAVTQATSEMLPSRILEKVGQNLVRTVAPDERLERTRYNSRQERISLFLQLSNEYKKRDSIVLNNYTERELKNHIGEQEKKIQTIQEQIDENLKTLKEAEKKAENSISQNEIEQNRRDEQSKSELHKYSSLVKNLFVKNDPVFTIEDILFYKDDVTTLFSPDDSIKTAGYQSYAYEKACVSAGINTLLTGTITAYGDYLSVSVEMYLYPGSKLIGSVMEIGSIQEFDLLSTNIAQQLVPLMTNSMPVQVQITVGPQDISSEIFMYLDDQLQDSFPPTMIFDSGVHTIQFTAQGYKTVATSYYFEGNQNYIIDVNLEELQNGIMLIGIERTGFDLFLQKLPFHQEYSDYGKIYSNGIEATLNEENKSQIVINGNKILGQFISEDGATAFYYIPEKLVYNQSMVTINPKAFDRSEYIDTRRKWMYGSYSALITSLIPSFYFVSNFNSTAKRVNDFYEAEMLDMKDYDKAVKLKTAANVSIAVSITCGVWFIYELVQYFRAANTVLPEKANAVDFVNPMPLKQNLAAPVVKPAEEPVAEPEIESAAEQTENQTSPEEEQ